MDKLYGVSEIYGKVIQGEGSFSGWPCAVLRLSTCNLWASPDKPSATCPWCDSSILHTKMLLTISDILDALDKATQPHNTQSIGIIVTGGEPLLQLDDELMEALMWRFQWMNIETNGTVRPRFDIKSYPKAHISCSPKTGSIVLTPDEVSWFKILVPAKTHLLPVVTGMARAAESNSRHRKCPVYLQPIEIGGAQSDISKHYLEQTLKMSLETGHPVSVQLHKYLGLR